MERHRQKKFDELRTRARWAIANGNQAEASVFVTAMEGLRDEENFERKVRLMDASLNGGSAGGNDGEEIPSLREALASDAVREFKSRDGGAIEFPFRYKDADPASANVDAALVEHVEPGIVGPILFPLKVADLFTQSRMDGASVTWLFVEDGADGKAGATTIGTQYEGPATFKVDKDQSFASKLTTSYTMPDENLEDLPALEQSIRDILLVGPNGMSEKIEDECLNGTDLDGILALNPAEQTLAASTDRLSKRIFAAATEVANAGFSPDACILNPLDAFEMGVEEDEQKRPLWGSPGSPYALNDQGGVPIALRYVFSRKIDTGTVLVGAFRSSTLYTRRAAALRIAREGIGLSDKGLVLLTVSARLALVSKFGKRPYRVVTIAS